MSFPVIAGGVAPVAPTALAAGAASASTAATAAPTKAARAAALTQARGFEQILVQELCQELSDSVQGSSADGSDGADGTSTSDGGAGSDPSATMFSSLLPQALGASVMSAGGVGIAAELQPSLLPSSAAGTPSGTGILPGAAA